MAIPVLLPRTSDSRSSAALRRAMAHLCQARRENSEALSISAVQVYKPYKPRRLKTDTYHTMLRKAQRVKPKNSLKQAQQKRTRKKWETRNRLQLRKRAQIVREKRKALGLDK